MKLDTLHRKVQRDRTHYGRIIGGRVRYNDLFFPHGFVEIIPHVHIPSPESSGGASRDSKRHGGRYSGRDARLFERIARERGGTVTDLKIKGE